MEAERTLHVSAMAFLPQCWKACVGHGVIQGVVDLGSRHSVLPAQGVDDRLSSCVCEVLIRVLTKETVILVLNF